MAKGTASKTAFYPASYLVMTVTSLLLLAAASGLGAMLISYWFNGTSSFLNDVFVLYWIASLAVVTPIHLLAYWQVRQTDKSNVTIFSLRFSHGLLGVYLFITVGSVITFATWLLALWLNALLGTGGVDKHLAVASLSLAQAIAWSAYATRHFLRARTDQSSPRYYITAVGVLSAVIIGLGIVFPALAYRDVAHDLVKENDLIQLRQGINEYVDTHETLPANLHDVSGLSDETTKRLGDYQYITKGETKFGIFGYELCATFAKSTGSGQNLPFGFGLHGAGRQCFARTTISFDKLNQDLAQYAKTDTIRLQQAIVNFLLGAKTAIDQEVGSVEMFASGQVKQLENHLEGLEGGTTELQQEMGRLEGNLTSLGGDTGQLAQDFAAVEQFLHDLGCLFGGCR